VYDVQFSIQSLLFSVRKLILESLGITEGRPFCVILQPLTTGRHDDDEAFALAQIQPIQLGCCGVA
jgi:hypothetical protein